MSRLRTVFRFTHRAAFWFCCVMAVVCSALMLLSVSPCTLVSHASDDAVFFAGAAGGLAYINYAHGADRFEAVDAHWSTVRGSIPERFRILHPIATTRVAVQYSTTHNQGWVVLVPLFILANFFALWPAIPLWRRWRANREEAGRC